MTIRTRMCISLDGCVATPDGLPIQLADPSFVPGESHGFPEFQRSLEAVLMGRTTFEPALESDRWPWPDVGGPQTMETFRGLGALDKLGLLVLPILIGDGMRLTPPFGTDARLTLESQQPLPEGAVEIVYSCG